MVKGNFLIFHKFRKTQLKKLYKQRMIKNLEDNSPSQASTGSTNNLSQQGYPRNCIQGLPL